MDLPYKWILGNVVIIATRQRAFHAVFPRRADHVVHVPILNSLAMIGMNGGTGSGSGKAGVREDLEDLDGLELDVNSNGHV